MRVQAERGGLGDEIALGWEYGSMEQLVEPKQEINEGTRLVYRWVEGTLQKEQRKDRSVSHPAAYAVSPVGAAALSGDAQGNRR